MRKLALLAILFMPISVFAEDRFRVSPSPFRPNGADVRTDEGRLKARIDPSPWRAGEMIIRDKDDRKIGRIRENPFRRGEWVVEGD